MHDEQPSQRTQNPNDYLDHGRPGKSQPRVDIERLIDSQAGVLNRWGNLLDLCERRLRRCERFLLSGNADEESRVSLAKDVTKLLRKMNGEPKESLDKQSFFE